MNREGATAPRRRRTGSWRPGVFAVLSRLAKASPRARPPSRLPAASRGAPPPSP
jgi:hypothetical protein